MRLAFVRLGLFAALLGGGCSHLLAPVERHDRVFDVPVLVALKTAQQILRERGVEVRPTEDRYLFASEPRGNPPTRWVVQGQWQGSSACTVRVFEVAMFEQGLGSPLESNDPNAMVAATPLIARENSLEPFRSPELELLLAERLDAEAAATSAPDDGGEPAPFLVPLELHSPRLRTVAPDGGELAMPIAVGIDGGVDDGPIDDTPPEPREPTAEESEQRRAATPLLSAPFLGRPPRAPKGPHDRDQADCGVDVHELGSFFASGNLLLLGDRLGTEEIPHAFSLLVCEAAARHLSVMVGLDLPESEQARLDAFLDSPGAPADRAALLAGAFWHWPYPDGTSSDAVVQLIDTLRQWRSFGARVWLVALGPNIQPGNPREAAIASKLLRQRRLHPDAFGLVLAGNAHVTRKRGAAWNPDLLPFGYRLATSDPDRVLSLDVAFRQGKQWSCHLAGQAGLSCGIYDVKAGVDAPREPPIRGYYRVNRFGHTNAYGFDGAFWVGELLTPSKPAASRE